MNLVRAYIIQGIRAASSDLRERHARIEGDLREKCVRLESEMNRVKSDWDSAHLDRTKVCEKHRA